MTTFDSINDATGFANGEKFDSEQQVREYFRVENMREMFGMPMYTEYDEQGDVTVGTAQGEQWRQSELDRMADAVIENRWHCDF